MTDKSENRGKLGTAECVILLIGVMVGSAIFSLSGLTILQAGPAAVLSWLLAGAVMLGYGLSMAELAGRYPRSGGVYYFPRLAFAGRTGQWLGWLSCWSCILTNIAAIAFSGIYVGIYLAAAFPAAAGLPLAAISILGCLVLNLFRLKIAGRVNGLLVAALILLMLTYVGCAFGSGGYQPELLTPFFTQGTGGPAGFLAAVPVAVIGYSGVIAPAFMAAEIREVRTTLPRAMRLAVAATAGLYALMLLATLGLVTSGTLQARPEMQFIPILCACFTKLSAVPYLSEAVSIAAALALLTTMNVCLAFNARAIQAAGADGSLPAVLGRTSAGGVPVPGVLLTAAAALLYAGFPAYTLQIVNFGAVFNILTMLLTLLALIQTHRTAPPASPAGKLLPWCILLILPVCYAAGLERQGLPLWLYTAGFLLLGLLIKLLCRR